jgi:L-arabinose isomerase
MINQLDKKINAAHQPVIQHRKRSTARIGVFGVAYFKYWEQFDGLLADMQAKQRIFLDKVGKNNVEVVDFGLVDNVTKAYDLVAELKAANLDLIFCDMLTYATSSTFGIIIKSIDIPIVLVALQPDTALDYANASTYQQLYNDDICSLPEFAGVAVRMGKPVPDIVIGTLHEDPAAEAEIGEYCRIASVLHDLKTARLGHIGHPIEAMLDMHTDFTMITAHFGPHVIQCEAHEIVSQYKKVTPAEIEKAKERILDFFDTPYPVSDPISEKLKEEDLYAAARIAVALEKFV